MVASDHSPLDAGAEALGDGEHPTPGDTGTALVSGDERRRKWWRIVEWAAFGIVVVFGGVAQSLVSSSWLLVVVMFVGMIGFGGLIFLARARQRRHSPTPVLDQEAIDRRFKASVLMLGAQQGTPAWVVLREDGFWLVGRGSTPGQDAIRYDELACVSRVRQTLVIAGGHLVRIVTRKGASFFVAAPDTDLDRLVGAAADHGVPVHEPETMSGLSRTFGRGRRLDLDRHALCLAARVPGPHGPGIS